MPWLRGWLGIFLLFQLCQLPLRLALQRHLNIIGAGEVADIPFNLALMVASPFWKVVKVFGYGVYAMFALGVVMSWYFSVRGSLHSDAFCSTLVHQTAPTMLFM